MKKPLVRIWRKQDSTKILTPLLCECTGDNWLDDLKMFGQHRIGIGSWQCPECGFGQWFVLPDGWEDNADLRIQVVKK